MSWFDRLFAGGSKSSSDNSDTDRAIDEELMFHLRALLDDQVAQGVSPDEAWNRAQERFGSLRHYSDTCRREARGEQTLWRACVVAGMALIVGLGAWLLVELRDLRRQQAVWHAAAESAAIEAAARHAQPQATEMTVEPRTNRDVVGTVLDHNGNPLAEAKLLVILKTWPNGRFQQQDFAAESDAQGNFRLTGLIPERGQYAVLVSAVKNGFALASKYDVVEEDAVSNQESIKLVLEEAVPVTLVVQDEAGRPIPNARIAPASRHSSAGEEHLIYWMASTPVQTLSDATGRVELDCFRQDDQAEIYLQLPGHDWEERAFRVVEKDEIVISSVAPSS